MIFRRALACAAGVGALLAPASASALGWSAPFRLAGPFAQSLTPAALSVGPKGGVTVAFTSFDLDTPGSSQAWLASRAGGARRLPGVQQVLDLTFSGGRLELLEVAGGRAELGRRAIGPPLDGAALGRLEPLGGGRVAAALADADGVWLDRGRVRLLGGRTRMPLSLAMAQTAGGRPGVAWLVPGRAMLASPATHVGLAAGGGHRLDGLALAPDGRRFTLAVTDSWVDRRGTYHAVVKVAGATFAVPGQAASDVGLAGDASRAQVLAFESCNRVGRCWVQAAYRSKDRRFSGPVRLGAVDPGQPPTVAVSAGGIAGVAWVYHARVYAAWRGLGARRWGPAHALNRSPYASAVTLAGGPGSELAAVWTQGTVLASVVGAVLG